MSSATVVRQRTFVLRDQVLPRVRWSDGIVLIPLLLISALALGINLFHYPAYFDDEGIYMARAWSVVEQGSLAPYTYFYDHAPAGWILIAAWSLLTGGFYTFGDVALDSGRVFMLVLNVAATYLVFRIARSISGSVIVAIGAALLFALSGYGLAWHRRVMLDNIATFWLLLSIALIAGRRVTMWHVWGGALALALSVLSKESTVLAIPPLAAMAYYSVHRVQRWFAAVSWLVISGSAISLYVLMAVLKGELFPSGSLLGGDKPHVSLLWTLSWQAGREKDGGVFDATSQFWGAMNNGWLVNEPTLVIAGSLLALLSIAMIRRHRVEGILGLVTVGLWAFIARGGFVHDQFLISLLPLLALNLVLTTNVIVREVTNSLPSMRNAAFAVVMGLIVVASLAGVVSTYPQAEPTVYWTANSSVGQAQATSWVQRNLPRQSTIVMDANAMVDLRDPPDGSVPFSLSHHYFEVDLDPEIRNGVFEGKWRNIDYVISNWELAEYSKNELPLVRTALTNSSVLARYDTGWATEIRRINKLQTIPADENPLLVRTWQHSKTQQTRPVSTPFGEAEETLSLLQATYLGDQQAFDAIWATMSRPGLGEHEEPTAGLALLMAAERWGSAYRVDAEMVMRGIWERTVVTAGLRLLGSEQLDGTVAVDAADLAPAAYRVFASADRTREWGELVDSAYVVLAGMADPEGQDPVVAATVRVANATGLDGALWSAVLDWVWFREARAAEALRSLSDTSQVVALMERSPGAAVALGVAALVTQHRSSAATELYAHEFSLRYHDDEQGAWFGDPRDAELQQWMWMSTALVDGALGNLANGESAADW